jgi:hypothetical protein
MQGSLLHALIAYRLLQQPQQEEFKELGAPADFIPMEPSLLQYWLQPNLVVYEQMDLPMTSSIDVVVEVVTGMVTNSRSSLSHINTFPCANSNHPAYT